jgi:hypothetical protein
MYQFEHGANLLGLPNLAGWTLQFVSNALKAFAWLMSNARCGVQLGGLIAHAVDCDIEHIAFLK